MKTQDFVKGLSIINPDDVEKDYLMFCIDYAIENNYNHIQITGPIHNYVKGNIEGMIPFRKYAKYNNEKDMDYVNLNLDAVNCALKKAHEHGIKVYMWHHELSLPKTFITDHPEILNENGDVEVSHPLIEDFLRNKIADFYYYYPEMDGFVLTLHETQIPLLTLKNQKLDKIARVKHVVNILFEESNKLGKEIIVRPFASLQEDQEAMLDSFAEISKDLLVMDKWTKFDWSLSLPDNDFFNKITKNAYIVEGDVFGEYFGKGNLPIMFTEHIKHKFEYCNKFDISGYCLRIDRNNSHPFGNLNEVNVITTNAMLNGKDPYKETKAFLVNKYGKAGEKVFEILSKTEDNQRKLFYLNGYYYTQGSYIARVDHALNHFWFEIMKDNPDIASDEWFIPVGWKRGSLEYLFEEKNEAREEAHELYLQVLALEKEIKPELFTELKIKFTNLDYVARIWEIYTYCIYNFTKYFEKKDEKYKTSFYNYIEKLEEIIKQGEEELKDEFYCHSGLCGFHPAIKSEFSTEPKKSFDAFFKANEKAYSKITEKNLTDYVICGGALESHRLKKEVNFSDPYIIDGQISRTAGNKSGKAFSSVNGHGWFSYEVKVKPNTENIIRIAVGNEDGQADVDVTLPDRVERISQKVNGIKEFDIVYNAKNENAIRIRFDRFSGYLPSIFTIKVL